MTGNRLRRVLQMPLAELRFRAGEAARTQIERARHVARAPRWHRHDLARILAPDVLNPELRTALAEGRWDDAGRRVRAMLCGRTARFFLDPRQALDISSAIRDRWPDAPAHARQQADTLLAGRYDLLGYTGLRFTGEDGRTNWHLDPVSGRSAPDRFWRDVPFLDPACGDHKVIWELNRHQYFLRLGRAYWLTADRRYAQRIVDDVQHWLQANPPLAGANWSSMLELAFRSLSWVTALHFLLGNPAGRHEEGSGSESDPWIVDLLVGLTGQLRHVERHLSRYFSPNTHLTGEALALYVTGVALPELRDSGRWMRTGRAILLEQIDRQINHDGGHAELSTCYHRYTTDIYALALMTAIAAGDHAAAGAFSDVVRRLGDYLEAFTRPDGTVPAIGDDDGGQLWPWQGRDPLDVRDSLELARTLTGSAAPLDMEETAWLAWSVRPACRTAVREPQPQRRPSEAALSWFDRRAHTAAQNGDVHVDHFPDSGYVTARTRRGDHLTFDVGPHGFLNGGHAHADALAVTLTLRGHAFLIDPGTATYTMDPGWRRRLRESQSHNTVTLGGRSSAVPLGAFQWNTRARARLKDAIPNPMFFVADGSHDGYLPAVHRRVIVYGAATGWLIVDEIRQPEAAADADVYWHFAPEWQVDCPNATVLHAVTGSGGRAWLVHEEATTRLHRGEDAEGWCSPRYGRLVHACSAQLRVRGAAGRPFATVIGDDRFARPQHVESSAFGENRFMVRARDERGTTLTLLPPAGVSQPQPVEADGVRTDARMLQLRTEGGRCAVSLAEATRVSGDALPFAIEADAPFRDLHVSVDEGVVRWWSRSPMAALRWSWRGAALPVMPSNGRERPDAELIETAIGA